SDIHPVHMAGIVTNRISTASGTGLAWLWDPSTPHMNGSFVLTAGPANMKPAGTTLAHEILHTFGLAHDTVSVSSLSAWGIMHEFSGGVPAIDWDAPSAVGSLTQGEAWLGMPVSSCHGRADSSLPSVILRIRTRARPGTPD